jgi:hypothetical protein
VTVVVSCRWDLAPMVGAVLSEGRPLPTREAPEADRVYFALPVRVGVGGVCRFINEDDVEVRYFFTQAAAYAWGERDAERRLMAGGES